MSVIATITVSPADFVLAETLTDNPDLRLRLERVVPIDSGFVPYLWASNHSVDAAERELSKDPDITSFSVVDRTDHESLIRVHWEGLNGVIGIITEIGATVLEGVGEAGRWRLQLRFDEYEDLTAFYQRCSSKGVSIDLRRVHDLADPQAVGIDSTLTEDQREALILALREGYFDVPRRITLVSIADRLGISDSAASQRIRRGLSALLDDLSIDKGGDGE